MEPCWTKGQRTFTSMWFGLGLRELREIPCRQLQNPCKQWRKSVKSIAMLIAVTFISIAGQACAGPCGKEIAAVTQFLDGGGSTTDALSAVAPAAGAGATPAASPEALGAVNAAKKADTAGDEASCMDYITKAKDLLGLL